MPINTEHTFWKKIVFEANESIFHYVVAVVAKVHQCELSIHALLFTSSGGATGGVCKGRVLPVFSPAPSILPVFFFVPNIFASFWPNVL